MYTLNSSKIHFGQFLLSLLNLFGQVLRHWVTQLQLYNSATWYSLMAHVSGPSSPTPRQYLPSFLKGVKAALIGQWMPITNPQMYYITMVNSTVTGVGMDATSELPWIQVMLLRIHNGSLTIY